MADKKLRKEQIDDLPISKVTGLQTALDGKAASLGADDNYVTDAEKVKLSNLSGTNSGDQTSIVGITGTKSQFNTAVTDGDILYTDAIGSTVQAYSAVLAGTTASFTTADETKLDGIEAGADVTDATNVDAAGAVMNSDTSTASMSFVVDEDNMTSNSATKVPTQQSVKAYADTKPTISSGAGAPGSTPTKVGDIYIDTTADDAYIAVGTASSADWEKSNDGTGGGGSGVQLPTYVVASSGGDYTTIQGALDAAASSYPQGCRIFLSDDTYTISSSLLVKSNNVVLEGNYRGTELNANGASVSPVIKTNAPASLYQGLQIKNLSFIQTNGTAQGVAIDASDMAICWYDNLIIYNFGTGIKFLDTEDITFYNKTTNVLFSSIADVCIDIDSHTGNSVNNNMFKDIRCSYGANGIGVRLDKAQLNTFYSCNFEPTSATGTVGIQVKATTADTTINNVFYSPYVEGNATGISLAANTHRTQFYGGQVVENTANLSDSGTNSLFAGIDIGYSQYNKFPDLDVADEAYSSSWNGSLQVPTKNAIYDKIETLGTGGGIDLGKVIATATGYNLI